MLIYEIPIGGNIELEVKYSGHTMSFRSNVIKIINNSVLIASIKANDQTIGFSDDCQINFIVKIDSKVYAWENVIVKLVRYDGAVYHKVDLIGFGKPFNRRDSFRMYIGEDMPLYISSTTGLTAITVLVKDISETGVAFITKDELDINRAFRLKLKDIYITIDLTGIIIRKEFLPNLNSYLYGCKFNERNQRLSKYIARKQGEQLRTKNNGTVTPFIRVDLKSKSIQSIGPEKDGNMK